MKPEKNGEKEKSFEENLERLETIVRELELGTLSLEDALRRFEEGVRLYRLCEERLKDAEQRVEILLKQ
ncbi:MAG TPA: exodeoxyribonuclease VII small subunit, partial [Candidatus Hydrogenedentes bacterium]|nr:exodeoxyribonuclease VII small subunit [Candidatus Hydrogenedentota bacterium]